MKTFIVAEIGLNHNGNLDTARKLVDVAVGAGVDAVKFQTYWNIPEYRHLGFSKCEWQRLFLYCELKKMKWFSTPFDVEAIRFLDGLGMDIWKLPSNKIVLHDGAMMEGIKKTKSCKQIILSTGISTFSEIEDYLFFFKGIPLTLLHCVSKYPTPIAELNLDRIEELQKRFNVPVGLSDHSSSVFAAPITAIEKGATIIEKHITLDNGAIGPDHAASLNPVALIEMVNRIHWYEGTIKGE